MKHIPNSDKRSKNTARSFEYLYNILRTLRSDLGCPWDRSQTLFTLRKYLIEEAYEVLDSIHSPNTSSPKEEIGDVLLVLLLMSLVAEDNQDFTTEDMLNTVTEKLIRRHPHVFGNSKAATVEEVNAQWETIKKTQELRTGQTKVSAILPPLLRAYELQKYAAKQGFDWKNYKGALEKVYEEISEVESSQMGETTEVIEVEKEIGDLFFAIINLSRKLDIFPPNAIMQANRKFETRFHYVQDKMNEAKLEMKPENLQKMEKYWEESKVRFG